jgi:hypothetical protein
MGIEAFALQGHKQIPWLHGAAIGMDTLKHRALVTHHVGLRQPWLGLLQ